MEDSVHIPGSKRDTCHQTSPPDIQICSEPITPFLLFSLLICTEKVAARAAMNFALEIMPGTDCHGLSIFFYLTIHSFPSIFFGLKYTWDPDWTLNIHYLAGILTYMFNSCSFKHIINYCTHFICIPLVPLLICKVCTTAL